MPTFQHPYDLPFPHGLTHTFRPISLPLHIGACNLSFTATTSNPEPHHPLHPNPLFLIRNPPRPPLYAPTTCPPTFHNAAPVFHPPLRTPVARRLLPVVRPTLAKRFNNFYFFILNWIEFYFHEQQNNNRQIIINTNNYKHKKHNLYNYTTIS